MNVFGNLFIFKLTVQINFYLQCTNEISQIFSFKNDLSVFTYFGTRNFLNISCDIDPRGMLHACHTFVNSFFYIIILAYFQETYNSQKKKKKGSYSSDKLILECTL